MNAPLANDETPLLERALAHVKKSDGLVTVVGPTASGKTALAIAIAEHVGGEIVSADSVQIYRGFDIGSGKPSDIELARVPHHLIGAIDPLDAVDAARFRDLADAEIAAIRARGKRPIVCGGTFLWTRALLFGLAEAPAADESIRAKHRAFVAEQGPAALHAELARVDAKSAARLHPNDVLRVSRALEVFETSGRTMSDVQTAHAFAETRHPSLMLAIRYSPDELSQRIERRVHDFFERGFIREVEELNARGLGTARAMGAVGYREVASHLRGELSREDVEAAVVRSTRVFARRQRTWLSPANAPDLVWLTP